MSISSPAVYRLLRNPNFPRPLPDELLYSLVARAAVHLGHWSPKRLLGAVYQDRGRLAIPDLPSALSLLIDLCGEQWGERVEDVAMRHTFIGYYTYFRTPEERAAMLRSMLDSRKHLHVRLGICSGGVVRTRFFRLCATCSRQDISQYGETYWRRSHHLPGVAVCSVHGEPLLETQVPFRPIGRHEHVAAAPRFLNWAKPVVAERGCLQAALMIAQRSVTLLQAPRGRPVTDYRLALRAHGFVGRENGSTRFRDAFAKMIPPELSRAMFTSLDEHGVPTWLDAARRKPRRALHPLKHVLLRLVIEGRNEATEAAGAPVKTVRRYLAIEPQLRAKASELSTAGLSTRAIASTLGVAWKTADRMLRPMPTRAVRSDNWIRDSDRSAWTALRAGSPQASRTQLRRNSPALYARLYRGDKQWLLSQSCAQAVRRPGARVDWALRDSELAKQIEVVARRMASSVPLIRVSRSGVLGQLQVRSLFAHRSAKLPKVGAMLAAHCETVRAFQLRRLVAVIRSESAGVQSGDLALLRAANINVDRFPDRGAALLDEARRLAT